MREPAIAAAAARGGVALAVDDAGVPQLMWASGSQAAPGGLSAEAAARWHLGRFAAAHHAAASDADAAQLVAVRRVGKGAVLAHLRQIVDGRRVVHGDVKVLMRDDLALIAVSGRLRPAGTPATAAALRLGAGDALAAALADLTGAKIDPTAVRDTGRRAGNQQWLDLDASLAFELADPARLEPVLFPAGDALVPAWFVEVDVGERGSRESAMWSYVVAAGSGRVLERRSLTASDAFTYRVWADPHGQRQPLDGPQADVTPHPTGLPDGTTPAFIPPSLVKIEAFNTNPAGGVDAWLPHGATATVGNNVDAYSDINPPTGLTAGDERAPTTGVRAFDYTYDTALEVAANPVQRRAGIASAFFLTNWMHDYWYDSGFDEAAGNAQEDNLGRGGVGGDRMRVELQDNFPNARNNANMNTPADGSPPRMQIYGWSGPLVQRLTLTPGGTPATGFAQFGPASYDVSGAVALANDGVPVTTNACEPLPAGFAGTIVLVDRGVCTFAVKAKNVQNAGGIAMIVANNVPGTVTMAGVDPTVTIPSMSISSTDGAALKTALAGGPVSARLFRSVGVSRDGAIDSGLVAHEWGHYLHHRLADCGAPQCRAQSEGWGDFVALHLIAGKKDDLGGTFATAAYSGKFLGDSAYFGIRRFPYSVDVTRNALSFRHIADGAPLPAVPILPNGSPNSEVHNAGEVWATMMWEAYVALQRTRGNEDFATVRRRMADLVVTGLQLAPLEATFTEQRDALMLAALAGAGGAGPADAMTIAEAFARRGAGTCAVSPPRESTNFVGVVESFELRPKGEIVAATVVDTTASCDQDGYLDAGERGEIVVTVVDRSPLALPGATVTITTATPGVSFPDGASAVVDVSPFGTAQARIAVALDAGIVGQGALAFDATLTHAEACQASVVVSAAARINVDELAAASTTDTVEGAQTAWERTGADATLIWSRVTTSPPEQAWRGIDFGALSDTQLQSPPLVVGTGAPFTLTFQHAHSFEGSLGVPFDGGVLELSRDGGASWQDVSAWVDPGYGGVLLAGNPLAGRRAYAARNPSYPARDLVSLDFGSAFAGETVRVRFRIGTDDSVSDAGWTIDDIAVGGIDNLPFAALVDDQASCP